MVEKLIKKAIDLAVEYTAEGMNYSEKEQAKEIIYKQFLSFMENI